MYFSVFPVVSWPIGPPTTGGVSPLSSTGLFGPTPFLLPPIYRSLLLQASPPQSLSLFLSLSTRSHPEADWGMAAAAAGAAAAPSRLMLRFRDGELRFAATDDALRVPLGYAIGAPFIRNERIFRLLDEYARTHARGGGADAVANIAAGDRVFMAREGTDTVTLFDLFVVKTISRSLSPDWLIG